jgi:predicted MPP superfamily phosphohydrolase
MRPGRTPVGRRHVLKAGLGLGVGALTGATAWGYFYERHEIEVVTATVPVAGLPRSLTGLRIALVTDVHRSDMVPASLVETAVRLVGQAAPDLIVLGGDYVTWGDRAFVQPAAEALAGLRAPLGVFAVLGNHDDDREMPAALIRQGFTVLRDARTTITTRGERIDLIGIRYWSRKLATLERLLKGAQGLPILLAHDPRRLTEAARLKIPLVLSGHTHGGQVVVPGLGAVAARKFPVVSGIGIQDRSTIFVSRGVGTVYIPLRVNCPPDVSILTLVPPGEAGAQSG